MIKNFSNSPSATLHHTKPYRIVHHTVHTHHTAHHTQQGGGDGERGGGGPQGSGQLTTPEEYQCYPEGKKPCGNFNLIPVTYNVNIGNLLQQP